MAGLQPNRPLVCRPRRGDHGQLRPRLRYAQADVRPDWRVQLLRLHVSELEVSQVGKPSRQVKWASQV